MVQRNFKKTFEFNIFSEIFSCDMTRFRNTNLDILYNASIQEPFSEKKYWP